MDISQQINELRRQIKLRQLADDGYFLSRQYKEDCRLMYELCKRLKNENN